MTNTILVPLDGSPAAESGLRSACKLARNSGATIYLMRTTMFFAGDRSTYAEERRTLREAKDYLAALELDLHSRGFDVISDVLPCDPVRGILFAAESRSAGLISMSTHGRTGLSHALLGSVAEAVLRKCDTPVLLTRAGRQSVQGSVAKFERVLVALDGSRLSEISLDVLERESVGVNAEIELIRVVPRHAPLSMPGIAGEVSTQIYDDTGRETDRFVHEAEAYLDKVGNARLAGRAWHSVVPVGSPCAEILDAATGDNADLIVVATHGRQGLDKVLYGSVALDLLRHVEVPLLVVQGRSLEVEAGIRQDSAHQLGKDPSVLRPVR
jgi:nucleotide-binding universal stress UspA family protein